MERRGRSVNIGAWPRVHGIVTCELLLDTQQLNHQSSLVFNGFRLACSYQHHISGEVLLVTVQTWSNSAFVLFTQIQNRNNTKR